MLIFILRPLWWVIKFIIIYPLLYFCICCVLLLMAIFDYRLFLKERKDAFEYTPDDSWSLSLLGGDLKFYSSGWHYLLGCQPSRVVHYEGHVIKANLSAKKNSEK
jgi:hypothetical protein